MHKLCLFFTVNVTASFTRATYNYTKLYVEITYVFDTCKVEISYNKCTIIFFMNNNYIVVNSIYVIIYNYSDILA